MWDEFQVTFSEHYFSDWVRERKMYEFIDLVQGVHTVAQYKAEFTLLVRFALGMISTEATKAAKFQKGLKVEIRHALVGARILSYSTMV